MKHLKKINERGDRFPFEDDDNRVTFNLHRDRDGYILKIDPADKAQLEKILTKNNIEYTIFENDLPF